MKTSAKITAEDKLNHLKTLFYRLRMRAAYERLTSILSDPDECGMSALDCIYEIMENEVQRRDSNALARRLKEAKICLPNARPDTIDFSIERGLDKNKIDALLTMRWMEEHQNIIITGAAGCGKTFLRYSEDGGKKDIHENDIEYLESCRKAALFTAEYSGWITVPCAKDGKPRGIEDISDEILEKVL